MSQSSETRTRADRMNDLRLAGRQLSTATIMFHQAVADRLGLNITDHKCLDLVLLNGSMTAGMLATFTGMTTGAITVVVDRLEKAGFVQRVDDPNDRRKVLVQAVPKNLGPAFKLFEPFATLLDEMASQYTDAELSVIVDFMSKSCTILSQSTAKLREESTPPPRKKGKTPIRNRTRKA